MRIDWLIGGPQGSGVDTISLVFARSIAKAGYFVYGNREYYSNIKGRHSYSSLAISDKQIHSINENIDILATFDAETLFQHFHEVKKVAIYDQNLLDTRLNILYGVEKEIADDIKSRLNNNDPKISDVIQYLKDKNITLIPVDIGSITRSVANDLKVSSLIADRTKNTIVLAISMKLLGLDLSFLEMAIKDVFKDKNTVDINKKAIDKANELDIKNIFNLKQIEKDDRVILDGTTASALGKINAGLGFQSYYPITPASDESTYIEAHQIVKTDNGTRNIVVLQTEDELAAINSAVGAALTGVRSATATSGPGFSLMSEGISWAGMNEVPVVITYYMRGAPATGLPTRSGQGDLEFALHVGHGEFPRIVIASGDHKEVYLDAIWAFNIAEKYQTPVIHIVEKALANSFTTLNKSLFDRDNIERGILASNFDNYKRFKFTDNGISPRAFLGQARIFYTGDEHNEFGHIDEESVNRTKMYEKRMKKLLLADQEIKEEDRLNVYGDGDIAVITWGSPKGVLLDIMPSLEEKGVNITLIQIKMFNPFPKQLVKNLLRDKKLIIDVESNYDAQAEKVMKREIGIGADAYILKWSGRQIMSDELLDAFDRVLKGNKKVVLTGGR